jgi:hypothetical protein
MPPRELSPALNRMDVMTQAFNSEVLHLPTAGQ